MPERLSADLGETLAAVATRLRGVKSACTNEESTKLYLILPLLAALGYDPTNPYEIYPEYVATFDSAENNRVDFAVLRDGAPIIAVECKKVGTSLSSERGQLRGYFNALQPVKLGILTDGVVWEFFVDSDEPNIMDEEPFLTLDLETIESSGVSEEILQALVPVTKSAFEPDRIAETAHVLLVKKRLRTALAEELTSPSEEFCRFALLKVGLKNVRRTAIERHYGLLVKTAINESLILPAAERLRLESSEHADQSEPAEIDSRVLTTDRELAVFGYVRRRLAFLVEDELHFSAIERVQYKDYIGKLVIFFDRERKGWLFDFIEGTDGYDKFMFPEPYGNIVTNNILDIDAPLKAVFTTRIREKTGPRLDFARIA